jgi:hypothetical protein
MPQPRRWLRFTQLKVPSRMEQTLARFRLEIPLLLEQMLVHLSKRKETEERGLITRQCQAA